MNDHMDEEFELDGAEDLPVSDEMAIILDRTFDAKALQALNILASGQVPKGAIQTHPGKGGKNFQYINHIYMTRQLNAALQQLWDMEVLRYDVWDDGTANAMVRMTIWIPLKNGEMHRRVITEVGAFEPLGSGDGKMKKAMAVASAVSRGLLRCCLRAFNIGSELYQADSEMTPNMAWTAIKRYAVDNNKVPEEILVQALKDSGVTSENIVDHFQIAWNVAGGLVSARKQEEMPKGL